MFNKIEKGAIWILLAFFGVIALIMLIGSVGLFFKIQVFRYLVIVTSLYFILFGFPIAIALFLCEKDVKVMFKRE